MFDTTWPPMTKAQLEAQLSAWLHAITSHGRHGQLLSKAKISLVGLPCQALVDRCPCALGQLMQVVGLKGLSLAVASHTHNVRDAMLDQVQKKLIQCMVCESQDQDGSDRWPVVCGLGSCWPGVGRQHLNQPCPNVCLACKS